MPYITSVEQIGYDRGREDGAQRQAISLISLLLEQKVGLLPDRIVNRINTLSPKKLEALAIALLRFDCIDDLMTWLGND